MYKIKLSPYAKLFYTEWLLDPDSSCYNIVIDQVLHGDLDIERLSKAFKRYISEHVLLNSHIKSVDEEPCWVKNDSVYELECSENSISKTEMLSYVSRNFDLYSGPLYRFRLIRIDNNVHRLIIVFHHLVIDGASADVGLFTKLPKYYNDENYVFEYGIDLQIELVANLTDKLSARLKQDRNEYKKFWRNQLYDIEDVDTRFLKLDRDANAEIITEKINHIREIRFGYEKTELTGLKQIQRKYKITPYVYGQCIFALLLNRYTGQGRFGISYPVAIKEGVHFIYGAHVNTNIIPYRFSHATTVVDLFNQSRLFFKSLKQNDINYSYCPIADIVQVGNKRLLDVIFVQTDFKDKGFAFDGITKIEVLSEFNIDSVSPLSFTDWISPLLFEQELRDSRLNYRIRYDKRAIDGELLSTFVTNYNKMFFEVLEDLSHEDNKQVSDYKILDQKQYLQVVYEWNRTKQNYPQETIHELFEEQVAKTPNKIAVIYENTKLTYLELNQRANKLANYLKNVCHIKSEDLVALYLNRSENMLVVILAVLKSGGAYVPLDPKDPADRISYILNDTQVKLILTNNVYLPKLKTIVKQQLKCEVPVIIAIDSNQSQSECEKQSAIFSSTIVPNNSLAYIIYTSGTTGKPNGVMIEHKGVINLYNDLTSRYSLVGNEVILQFASYVFDASVEQIVLALLNGYTLLLIPNKLWLNPERYNSYLIDNQVTHIHATPPFLEQISFNGIKTLKRIISGGDLLHINLFNYLKNTNKNVAIINEYGPTETTITCVVNTRDTHHIGKPISNMQAYVLGHDLTPLPIGAIGELYIGGEGLARGYINKPELTQERFITNPFQTQDEKNVGKNAKLYKTGDKGRWLPNGDLEYIGRDDSQVKLRGYRIELGEIEEVLRSYPGIKHAIAAVKEFTSIDNLPTGNKYLVCYYVVTFFDEKQGSQDYVATWQSMYQKAYKALSSQTSKENFLGWDSSYTGLPIEQDHMKEWLNSTINKIKSLYPTNVLEIGSGSGLILFNVVDFCKYYYATDFSANAVDYLRQGINSYNLHNKVELFTCKADDIPYHQITKPIDTVVINSVVQYFPNIEYLEQVIKTLIDKIRGISQIFIGDIRNYCLFDVFYHSVLLYKNGSTSKREIEFYKHRDKELLISPTYFLHLAQSLPQIDDIEVFAKECDFENELSKFRYDLTIHLNSVTNTCKKEINYQQFILVGDLVQYIKDNIVHDYIFIKYPNKCIYCDYKQYLAFADKNKEMVAEIGDQKLLNIGQIKQLALSCKFNSKFYLDIQDGVYLNIIFYKSKENINDFRIVYDADNLQPDELFNNPSKMVRMLNSDLSEKINQYLSKKLPSYMIPDVLINIDALPLTINGKLDKAALPHPEFITFDDYVAPSNKVEKKICDLYAIILALPKKQIGINHDFFKLGGNSILAIQLVVKLQHDFKINVSDIFVLKTPARIAEFVVFAQDNLHKKLEQIKLRYEEKDTAINIKNNSEQSTKYIHYVNETKQFILKKQSKNIRCVLLTGSTGHLGCNIFYQLLLETSYKIYLLVRANSNTEAYDRVSDKFMYYFTEGLERFKGRFIVLVADLEQPNLDLNTKEYQELVANIDSIIHAAALVKHYGNYEEFYCANVQTTINLLELAKLTNGKDFHYMSTIGVFYDGYVPNKSYYVFNEFDDADILVDRSNVYAQTKYEGEVIARKYRKYGVTSNIYRLGNVAMHSISHRHQKNLEENSFFTRIKTILGLKIAAKEIANVEISPVDSVALAIVKIFDQTYLSNQVYHIFNPHLCNLVELFTTIPSLNIKPVVIDEFIDHILEKLNDNAYRKQIELFMLHQFWLHEPSDNCSIQIEVVNNKTETILSAYGFCWPSISKEMLSDIVQQACIE